MNIKEIAGSYKASFEAAIGLVEYLERTLPTLPKFDACPDKERIFDELLETVAVDHGCTGWDSFINEPTWTEALREWAEELIESQLEQERFRTLFSDEERLLRAVFGPPATNSEQEET